MLMLVIFFVYIKTNVIRLSVTEHYRVVIMPIILFECPEKRDLCVFDEQIERFKL